MVVIFDALMDDGDVVMAIIDNSGSWVIFKKWFIRVDDRHYHHHHIIANSS